MHRLANQLSKEYNTQVGLTFHEARCPRRCPTLPKGFVTFTMKQLTLLGTSCTQVRVSGRQKSLQKESYNFLQFLTISYSVSRLLYQ